MAEQVVNYKCPACMAPISFKPDTDKCVCEFCNTEFNVETIKNFFADKERVAAKTHDENEDKWKSKELSEEFSEEEIASMQTFTCSSCGAELVCDQNTMATECCYCGNPAMIPGRFSKMLKPKYIIPFKKTKNEAMEALKEFYKGKELLPDLFTQQNRIEAIQGMYVPFWLFNIDVEGQAIYKASESFATTSGKTTTTVTDYYECLREGTMSFEFVPVDGSVKMEDDFMESIEPFDYRDLVPFESAYMAGYLADKYDVDADTAVRRAKERMQDSVEKVLRGTVTGYDEVGETLGFAMLCKNAKSFYAMAPVWIVTTRFEDKPYTFMMNGQTGKFIGRLPIDVNKSKKLMYRDFAIGAVVVFLLIVLVGFLVNTFL
ncbi:MAG: hypothetical protein Q4D21_10495 [Phascolarctobacterium sp.]|nr:hypothetical protein [Phascolarctobacterium sp.]